MIGTLNPQCERCCLRLQNFDPQCEDATCVWKTSIRSAKDVTRVCKTSIGSVKDVTCSRKTFTRSAKDETCACKTPIRSVKDAIRSRKPFNFLGEILKTGAKPRSLAFLAKIHARIRAVPTVPYIPSSKNVGNHPSRRVTIRHLTISQQIAK